MSHGIIASMRNCRNSEPIQMRLSNNATSCLFQVTLLREMEERYEREVVLHGETTKALIELREAAQSFDEQVVQLQSAKRQAEEGLKDLEARCFEIETSSKTEMELLQNQYDVVEKENAALHEQLSNMSHLMTTLNKSGADLDVSLAGNESSDQVS